MELDISWDEDLFGVTEKKREKPKQQPYNVKVCENEHFFNNTAKPDGLEKQNAIKFQADYWYQFGQYRKALAAYQAIHDNPQVSSLTVERDIDESIIRCQLKLGNLSIALDFLSSLIKQHGEDTSLLLLLAEVCSRTEHLLGEIICLKKCISFHPYNHNFWYSLSKAYAKMYQQIKNSGEQINNEDNMKNKIDEILQLPATRNFKDCLKLVVNCYHCGCLKQLTLIDKVLICGNNRNKNGTSIKRLMEESVQSVEKLKIEENVVLSETVLCSNQDNLMCKRKSTPSEEKSKDQENTNEEVPCLLTMKDQSSESCSFNMTIMKLSDTGLQSTKCSQQDGLSLLAFFCLLRTRFLLQRAIWTSMLFVKDKLYKTMMQVQEDVENFVLCHCGELKTCILKQIEGEDTEFSVQQVDELDMHSLYQGTQKHWT